MKTVNKKLLNVYTPILNQLIHRLLPETLNTIIILAGFLTYFAFEHPSHFHSETVDTSLAKDIDEDLQQRACSDSHRIPFSPHD